MAGIHGAMIDIHWPEDRGLWMSSRCIAVLADQILRRVAKITGPACRITAHRADRSFSIQRTDDVGDHLRCSKTAVKKRNQRASATYIKGLQTLYYLSLLNSSQSSKNITVIQYCNHTLRIISISIRSLVETTPA